MSRTLNASRLHGTYWRSSHLRSSHWSSSMPCRLLFSACRSLLCRFAFLLLSTSLPTFAETSLVQAEAQYAWRAAIENGQSHLRRIKLAPMQLAGATRQDLGDIVILDADGVPAPLLIRKIPDQIEQKEVALTVSSFSAVANNRARTVTATEQIQTETGVSTRKTTETISVPEARTDYVVQLSDAQLELGIQSLELQWRGLSPKQLLRLNIESVKRFDQFGQGTVRHQTLAQNSSDKEWQSIKLKTGTRLHRISIDNPPSGLELVAVKGRYQKINSVPVEWGEPQDTQLDSHGENSYLFQLPKAGAASVFRLLPAESNTVLRGALSVSNRGWQNKTTLFSDIQQHNLSASAQIKPSKNLPLPRALYEQWWFISGQALKQAPSVQLGFEPRELVFYANGPEPYTLVWGNKDAPAARNTLADLLTDQTQLINTETLIVSDRQQAGGTERLLHSDNSWLSWLLWLVLGIAVALTGRMALSLVREMKTKEEK